MTTASTRAFGIAILTVIAYAMLFYLPAGF
jgi:hypothetical protein